MTLNLVKDVISFENADCLPLEDLKFKVISDGVTSEIDALSCHWIENRCHALYPGIPKSGIVEVRQWLIDMSWYNRELEWILGLPHFKFWSSFVFDGGCIESLVSFLQEASPYYSTCVYEVDVIKEAYSLAHQRVLSIFCRLITPKENEKSWMRTKFLAKLLYENCFITIPILWDLTALYGKSNKSVLSRIIHSVFKIEPKYHNDLEMAYKCLQEKVFATIELHANGFIDKSPTSRIDQYYAQPKPPEAVLGDLAMHLLDCATTMQYFFELCPFAKIVSRNTKMYISIAHLFDECIPSLSTKLNETDNLLILDFARVELIECYRLILNTCTEEALSDPSNSVVPAELFLEILSETLSALDNQKAFVTDLLKKQPLQKDLAVLKEICKELDLVKCDFILQSLMTSVDDPTPIDKMKTNINNNIFPSKGVSFSSIDDDEDGACGGNVSVEVDNSGDIAAVCEVFPYLGSGYVKRLLEHYSSSEHVISAILEGNMPAELNALDKSELLIPRDPVNDELYSKLGSLRLNVFDGDEFDIRVRDVPKGHWQSKSNKGPQNINTLLNDKRHVNEVKATYQKYGMICDNSYNMYDDDFDDSYIAPAKTITEQGPNSNFRRPNQKPRVLRRKSLRDSKSEEEEVEQIESTSPANIPTTNFRPFCENPEEVRARREAKRGGKMPSRDVVGKPKGQGQDKDVAINRDKKNTNKSSRANHNRRQGAQWKRSRGMIS